MKSQNVGIQNPNPNLVQNKRYYQGLELNNQQKKLSARYTLLLYVLHML